METQSGRDEAELLRLNAQLSALREKASSVHTPALTARQPRSESTRRPDTRRTPVVAVGVEGAVGRSSLPVPCGSIIVLA